MNARTGAERLAWLRLARSEQVGAITFHQLVRRFGSASAALAALPDLAERAGGGRPSLCTAEEAAAEMEAGAALGARLILPGDPQYPRLLAAVDPPPPALWVLGDPGLTARPAVAIVGARIASAAGQRFARALAADLGDAGYAVVSGLARGIDTAAHEGSLATGAIGVVAGGVDAVYPPENEGLFRRMAKLGALISEPAPGHVARARDFPRRNRIISGLALGVVVVEAELRSGSLITARLAGEQGREVFAVPGSPLEPRARGANDLIRQGATLVESAEDVIRAFGGVGRLAEPDAAPLERDEAVDGGDVDDARERVAAALSPAPTSIDEIARATGDPAFLVVAALAELSLARRAELLAGGFAVRA